MSKHRISPATENTPDKNCARAQEGAALPRSETARTPVTLQQRFLRTAALLTVVYLCAMFLGHPLIFTNYYFNITETKHVYFLVVSGLYLLLLLLARIALPPDFGVTRAHVSLHPAALLIFAFYVVSVTGSLISRYGGEAFFGENNRYQGLLTLFCYACLIVVLSRQKIDLRWPERAFLLGACIVSLLGVLNHFTLDPFGFYNNLREMDRGRFLSTIGNADFYASYIGMAFAVSFGFFLHTNGRLKQLLSTLILALVCFGTLVAGSDSAALGLIAVAALMPLLLFSDATALRRMPLGWGVFFLCAFFFGLLSNVFKSATFLSSFVTILYRPAVSLSLSLCSVLLWFALKFAKPEQLAHAKKPYAITLLSALLFGVLALVLLNTLLKDLPLGSLEQYLRFNDSWGTDRGKIWAFVLRVYEQLPPVQKLFGASSGGLFHADSIKPLFSDAALDTAHNEYLQYLVTNGALGLVCYLAAMFLALRVGFRRSKREPVYRGLTLAVIAYLAQATVNIAQPMTTPILFVLIGILISKKPEPDSPAV
ncbi:MAG: O-antigen ligase family protein [Christensenella sp.]|nr:O-antigen ligase family protein [Christensenella sp.]